MSAGGHLGNHTFSHPHPASMSVEQYLAEVDANEALLRDLVGDSPEQTRSWKVFRYPFLEEGTDLPSRAAIRAGLATRGYRIAQVTMDFYDWAYNGPYARCLAKGDEDSIAALKQDFIDHAAANLRWADAAARELVGRPVPQILLLHVGAFDAVMMDELLSTYEKNAAGLRHARGRARRPGVRARAARAEGQLRRVLEPGAQGARHAITEPADALGHAAGTGVPLTGPAREAHRGLIRVVSFPGRGHVMNPNNPYAPPGAGPPGYAMQPAGPMAMQGSTCQNCGRSAPTKNVMFMQNIGCIVIRFPKTIRGTCAGSASATSSGATPSSRSSSGGGASSRFSIRWCPSRPTS